MERLQTLKTIIWIIAGLLALEIIMMIVMLRPSGFYLWSTIGIIAILCFYLVRLSFTLLAELRNKEENNKGGK